MTTKKTPRKRKAAKPAKPQPGPATKFTAELADEICRRMANGDSLRSICRDDHMPAESTVRGWAVDDQEGFAERYERARGMHADALFDDALEIADDATGDLVEGKDGKKVLDHEHVQRSKLRVDTRKWAAARLAAKYGAKDQPIKFDLPDIESSDDLVKAMAAVLMAVSVGKITLADGQALGGLIDVHRRTIETADIESRVKLLEDRMESPK